MATSDDTAKWLQDPQSLTVLLRDNDTKIAILNYIKAVTQKAAPEPEWREVWRQDSEQRRILSIDRDEMTGERDVRRSVIVEMVVYFSQSKRVAKLAAMIAVAETPVYLRDRPGKYLNYRFADISDWVYEDTTNASEYTDAISWGQTRWSDALTWFHSKTTPTEEQTNA